MANKVVKYHAMGLGNMKMANDSESISKGSAVELSSVVSPFSADGPRIDVHEDGDFHVRVGEKKKTGSTIFGAGFNFVNSIVGAGIIGMPIAIRESGFFMGIFLLVLVAFLIDRSVILLVECGIKCGKTNLEELSEHLFGKRGYTVATCFMFIYAYGAMAAYMLIIGDTVPVVLDYAFGSGSLSRDAVIAIMAIFIILPLSLLRDMSSLAFTSLLSISADLIMIIFVLANAPVAAKREEIEVTSSDYNFINYQIFEGIGTFSFAFVCQHNTFIVFESMKTPTLPNWRVVSHGSLAIAGSMCLTLGLAGYLNFGAQTEGDILNNFSESDSLMLGARMLLAITMVFTYPMECFVCRHALVSVIRSYQEKDIGTGDHEPSSSSVNNPENGDGQQAPSQDHQEEEAVDTVTHVALTLGLWGSTVIIALVFNDLRIVLALTGALAASMLGYILPAMIYFKTFEVELRKAKLAWDVNSEYYRPRFSDRVRVCRRFLVPAFLLGFGIVALVIGVSTVMYDIAHSSDDA